MEPQTLRAETMSVAEPRDLVEILSRMEFWRQEPPVERQRWFKRFTVRGEAELTLLPGHAAYRDPRPISISLRDVSRAGLGFLATEAIEPGAVGRVAFQFHGQKCGEQCIVVRFSRLVHDGLFLCGGQFIIEPYLMLLLGVDAGELGRDIRDKADQAAAADFVDPDAV